MVVNNMEGMIIILNALQDSTAHVLDKGFVYILSLDH